MNIIVRKGKDISRNEFYNLCWSKTEILQFKLCNSICRTLPYVLEWKSDAFLQYKHTKTRTQGRIIHIINNKHNINFSTPFIFIIFVYIIFLIQKPVEQTSPNIST
jgi:hypothetical protein